MDGAFTGLIIRIFGFVTLLKFSLPLANFFRYRYREIREIREIRYRLTVLVTVNNQILVTVRRFNGNDFFEFSLPSENFHGNDGNESLPLPCLW